MCLILFALDAHPRCSLVLAANRDELHARPALPAHWWDDAPWILAGRDQVGGGTWMGVTRGGRWAAVTNFRDPAPPLPDAPSRGDLVADYLRGTEAPERYIAAVAARAPEFNGFNLLVGGAGSAWWLSNRAPAAAGPVAPGVHGLSNHLLDTPWSKVVRGRGELTRCLADPDPDPDALLDLLLDRTLAADHPVPAATLADQRERVLSASFILGHQYGTRVSTALMVDHSGDVRLVERWFRPGTLEFTTSRFHFPLRDP